jgi:hypothetical protein
MDLFDINQRILLTIITNTVITYPSFRMMQEPDITPGSDERMTRITPLAP